MFLTTRKRKALAVALVLCQRKRVERRRRIWVHETFQSRKLHGEFHHLVRKLRLLTDWFQVYFRLDQRQFDNLLSKIGPQIIRFDWCFREAISPTRHLAICLRYLATGDSYPTTASSYRVGISTVACIVPSVAKVIWECFVRDYMPVPRKEDWKEIARAFQHRWNVPNSCSAIDRKHVVIQAPPQSGSQFYNYKEVFLHCSSGRRRCEVSVPGGGCWGPWKVW